MKRIISILLAVSILASLLCVGSFSVSAASDMKPSEDMIEIVKLLEGFAVKPYYDNRQYSVGYGTRPLNDEDLDRYMKEGISEEEATQLLMHYLEDYATDLNAFADKWGLSLTQGQFDSLLSLSYNCGPGWMSKDSTLRRAIIQQKTGNDLLFAIGQWSTSAGVTSRGLVRRRLIECNMYLNGEYSLTLPANYKYVIYDNTNGTAEIKVQCYDSNDPPELYSIPTRDGYTFAGWYTQEDGGQKLTNLANIQGNPTIYAHWILGDDSGNTEPDTQPEETTQPEGTMITVTATDVNLRKGPGTSYGVAGKANKGDEFMVTTTKQGGDYLWGLTSKGWIALKYTTYGTESTQPPATTPAPTQPPATTPAPTQPPVTTPAPTQPPVTTPAPTQPPVTTPAPTQPPVTTPAPTRPPVTTPAPTQPPVTTPEPTQPPVTQPPATKPEASGTKITVTATDVNLRKGPGTGYALMGKANKGDQLTVTATKQGGSYLWGQTAKGWIALKYTNYSQVTQEPEEDKDEPATPPTQTPATKLTGTTTADKLNIRKGPSTAYAKVGTYLKGTKIEILEKKVVGSSTWGKTDKGWISMNYVKLDEVKEDPKPTEPKPTEPKPTEPKPTEPPKQETVEKVMGTITTDSLRIRSGAGITYSIKGYLNTGDRVEILDQKTVGSMTWGRIAKGWISMNYVKLDKVESDDTPVRTGKVSDGVTLRVRSGPSDSYAITAYLTGGTRVTIQDVVTVGTTQWGKVDKGWVQMDYIILDGAVEEEPEASVIRGTTTATQLYVRQTAGMSGRIVGSLPKGTKVEILQTRKVGTMTWGQTSQGWISMDYVKIS